MEERTRDQVDGGSVGFLKSITEDDISCILLETTLSGWDRIWRNPILFRPQLWEFSEFVRRLSKLGNMFDEVNSVCTGSVITRVALAVDNLPCPFTIGVFCAMLAWLGPACKRETREETRDTCMAVATILHPALQKLEAAKC